MSTLLTTSQSAAFARIKSHPTAVLFSFLLLVSFLASCTTEDPASTTDIGDTSTDTTDPTIACPEGLVVLTLPDGATDLTLTETLTTVTAEDDSGDVPTITYDPLTVTAADTSVTVTATDAADNSATCDFTVRVSDTLVALTPCPDPINNAIINTFRTWTAPTITGGSEDLTVAFSVTSDDATASTATVSETGGTFAEVGTYTVTFTAMNANDVVLVDENSLSCSFDVTVNTMTLPLAIACPSGETLVVIIPFDETSVTLAEAGIIATSTGGTGEVAFSYSQSNLSASDNDKTLTATATDSVTPAVMDTCDFTVSVTQAPEPTLENCPSNILVSKANTPLEWEMPTTTNLPTESTLEVSTTAPTTVTETGGTFTVLGRYGVTFQVEDSSGNVISVRGNDLICTFEVKVTDPSAIQPPPGNLFALAMTDAAPGTENPFLIQNTADLVELATVVNGDEMYGIINEGTPDSYRTAHYRLESNITLPNTENNFTPIGIGSNAIAGSLVNDISCNNTCFEGNFDGNSKTISGLHFNNTDDNHSTNVGLFGVISSSNASISNLILADVDITASTNVGGLVGVMISDASISNVYATGSVSGASFAGGLVGEMRSMSSMTSGSAAVDVSVGTTTGGGLAGSMTNSTIINSFASGTITGERSLGGIVGAMTTSSITNAYSSATVSGALRFIGGIVGLLSSSNLTNTLAWGPVTTSSSTPSLIGGLVGTGAGSIIASYWDNTEAGTGQTMSEPSDTANGMNTAALQMPQSATDIYTNWNNASDHPTAPGAGDVWDFGTDTQYPRLGGLLITAACQRDSSHTSCL